MCYPNDVVMVKYDILDPFGTVIGRGMVPMVHDEMKTYGLVQESKRVPFLLGLNAQLQHSIQFYL